MPEVVSNFTGDMSIPALMEGIYMNDRLALRVKPLASKTVRIVSRTPQLLRVSIVPTGDLVLATFPLFSLSLTTDRQGSYPPQLRRRKTEV